MKVAQTHPARTARRRDGGRHIHSRLILLDSLVHDAALLPQKANGYWAPIVEYLRFGNLSRNRADQHDPCIP